MLTDMPRQALDLARQFGSEVWQASCLNRLADIATARGDVLRAIALRAESKSIYTDPYENLD